MRLVVDVNNGESGIVEQIVAARIFLKTHRDCVVILCGNVEKIKKHLKKKDRFECLNSTGLIDPNVSNYLEYLRDKKSSLYVACEYVKNGHADGILSNAATSAFTIITTFVFGLIPKIKKPAFMSFIPTIKGQGFLMLDEGAQLMCSGEDLYAFAKMANTYCLNVLHKKKPIIKILNIGTEIKKGLAYHHEAYELLSKDKKLNFQGFIEGTNLLKYGADIVVSDGYSGNLALKTMEGTLSSLNQLLKKNYKK
jgi:glycerol-3-phosphate acyltransferase PlsX